MTAFVSSPEPKAPGELLVWEASVVRRPSTLSNDFSSETTGPNVTKFHMKHPGTSGTKKSENGFDPNFKMAAMLKYGKR